VDVATTDRDRLIVGVPADTGIPSGSCAASE